MVDDPVLLPEDQEGRGERGASDAIRFDSRRRRQLVQLLSLLVADDLDTLRRRVALALEGRQSVTGETAVPLAPSAQG